MAVSPGGAGRSDPWDGAGRPARPHPTDGLGTPAGRCERDGRVRLGDPEGDDDAAHRLLQRPEDEAVGAAVSATAAG